MCTLHYYTNLYQGGQKALTKEGVLGEECPERSTSAPGRFAAAVSQRRTASE